MTKGPAPQESFTQFLREIASRKEVLDAFKRLAQIVKEARSGLEDRVNEAEGELKDQLEGALEDVKKAESDMSGAIAKDREDLEALISEKAEKLQSDMQSGVNGLFDSIAALRKIVPKKVDLGPILSEIEAVRGQIPEIPEIPERFDPSDIEDQLDKIEEEIKKLKKRPSGTGGGVTNLRIQQAFKYILKTEQPSGAIDGANTDYTVTQPIFAVLAFSLNGEVIAQLPNYTIMANTITFATALPAAYSGKDFEVKYV